MAQPVAVWERDPFGADKKDLMKLREVLHKALVEVEMAADTATYPDWAETKENLLKAI